MVESLLKKLETVVNEPVSVECLINGKQCGAFATGHRKITYIFGIERRVGDLVVEKKDIYFVPENEERVNACVGHQWIMMGL